MQTCWHCGNGALVLSSNICYIYFHDFFVLKRISVNMKLKHCCLIWLGWLLFVLHFMVGKNVIKFLTIIIITCVHACNRIPSLLISFVRLHACYGLFYVYGSFKLN